MWSIKFTYHNLGPLFLRPACKPTNTSLRTLVLRNCSLEPEFLDSLAYACKNIRQLTIDGRTHMISDSIKIPEEKLVQLDLDLKFILKKSRPYRSLALITIVNSDRTWYF